MGIWVKFQITSHLSFTFVLLEIFQNNPSSERALFIHLRDVVTMMWENGWLSQGYRAYLSFWPWHTRDLSPVPVWSCQCCPWLTSWNPVSWQLLLIISDSVQCCLTHSHVLSFFLLPPMAHWWHRVEGSLLVYCLVCPAGCPVSWKDHWPSGILLLISPAFYLSLLFLDWFSPFPDFSTPWTPRFTETQLEQLFW